MAPDDTQGRKSSTEKKLEPTKNKRCFGVILSWRISHILSSLWFLLFLVAFLQTAISGKNKTQVLCFSDATQHQQLWGSNCTWAILIPIWGWTPDPWTLAQHPTIYIFLIFPWLIPNQNVSINFRSENDPNQAEASLEATSLERKQLHGIEPTAATAQPFGLHKGSPPSLQSVSHWSQKSHYENHHLVKGKQPIQEKETRYKIDTNRSCDLGFQLQTWIHYLNLFLLHPKSKNFIDSKNFINHSPKQMSPPFFGLGEGIVSIPITLVPSNNSRTAISLVINCPGKGSSETGRGNCHDGSV